MADKRSEQTQPSTHSASKAHAPTTGIRDGARSVFPERSVSSAPWWRGWMIGAGALAVALLSGAVVAGVGGGSTDQSTRSISVEEQQKQLAAFDAERKRREDGIADIQRRANAKESELAETGERVAALEKRRETLQRQVAELAGPLSPSGGDATPIVADAGEPIREEGSPPDEIAKAALDAPTPPTPRPLERRSADARTPAPEIPAGSTASVDAPRAPAAVDRQKARVASVDDGPSVRATPAAVTAMEDEPKAVNQGGSVRVFIHVRSSDPAARNRARAVAAELRRRGVSVAEIRGVRLPVRRDSVRFFYDADRSAVSELQQAVQDASSAGSSAPVAQDYRSYGAPPRQGTIELWLS